MIEQKNTPALRFPEFKENWKEFSLEDKSDLITKGTTPKVWDKNGEVNFIKVENIEEHSGKVKTTSKISYHEHSTHLRRSILEEGDILFSIAGTLGRITIINKEILPANTNQALAIIRNTSINKYYLKTYLLGKSIKEYIRKNPTVGAQPNLSLKQIKSFKIKTPDFIEQEKIGTFFSKLDRQIELEEKKLEILEQQKRGYMQTIFSQELRFKDENGNNYSNWEKVKFNYFMSKPNKLEKGKDIQKDQLLTVKLQGNGVCKANINRALKLGSTVYYKRFTGQFIYGKQNFFNGAFGIVPDDLNCFYSSGDVPALNLDNNKITNDYFINYISRKDYYKKKEAFSTGTGSKRIHENTLLEFDIMLPSIEEQNKIGNFFNKLHELIEIQSSKVELLKERKKGLLQKMFV